MDEKENNEELPVEETTDETEEAVVNEDDPHSGIPTKK